MGGNRPYRHFDYSRPLVAMITLKALPGVRLCRITQERFEVNPVGRIVQEGLLAINQHHPQVKLGHYQIMPDHLHVILHVVKPLPEGTTLQSVVRGFKIGANCACREEFQKEHFRVFEQGMHHTLIMDREHLEREVLYVRDNVRRYRLLQANRELFREAAVVGKLNDGTQLWGFGNHFLLEHPRKVQIEISRSSTEEEWEELDEKLAWWLSQGYVFVSPFISPHEKRVLANVVERQGLAIRITHRYFGERYKPQGELFDLCCEGRLLELSVAGEFERYTRLDRMACLRMNEVAREVAAGRWRRGGFWRVRRG